MPDLTAWDWRMAQRTAPKCGGCALLDPDPLPSGVRFCHGQMTWRFAEERIPFCHYREDLKETA